MYLDTCLVHSPLIYFLLLLDCFTVDITTKNKYKKYTSTHIRNVETVTTLYMVQWCKMVRTKHVIFNENPLKNCYVRYFICWLFVYIIWEYIWILILFNYIAIFIVLVELRFKSDSQYIMSMHVVGIMNIYFR